VPVGVTGHRTQRPRGQVGPLGAHPAHPSSPLDPGGEQWPIFRTAGLADHSSPSTQPLNRNRNQRLPATSDEPKQLAVQRATRAQDSRARQEQAAGSREKREREREREETAQRHRRSGTGTGAQAHATGGRLPVRVSRVRALCLCPTKQAPTGRLGHGMEVGGGVDASPLKEQQTRRRRRPAGAARARRRRPPPPRRTPPSPIAAPPPPREATTDTLDRSSTILPY
jgi:hypothetical protein